MAVASVCIFVGLSKVVRSGGGVVKGGRMGLNLLIYTLGRFTRTSTAANLCRNAFDM